MTAPVVGDAQYQATAGVGGGASVTVTPPPLRQWKVAQVSVAMPDAGGSASCGLYKNGVLVSPLVPQGDAASGDPAVILRPGDQLVVQWTAAKPGAAGTVLVFYEETRR